MYTGTFQKQLKIEKLYNIYIKKMKVRVSEIKMVHVTVCHRVEDYGKWKQKFDEDSAVRKANGCQGGKLYQGAGEPNLVSIAFEWDTLENLQKFLHSDELKRKMEDAGVVGAPEVHILEKVEDFTD